MNQPIAGVVPHNLNEVTVMTIWPSISVFGLGRFLGTLYNIKAGFYIFTLGNLCALASIPLALLLYFARIAPGIGIRYRLTNRRVVVQRGLTSVDEKWVELDRFDEIDVVVQAGQEWFKAGDLVFRLGALETFRISGVSRPQAFRQSCLKSHLAFVGVEHVYQQEPATV